MAATTAKSLVLLCLVVLAASPRAALGNCRDDCNAACHGWPVICQVSCASACIGEVELYASVMTGRGNHSSERGVRQSSYQSFMRLDWVSLAI
ncbi:hypothetical protein U9M48_011273 [Paspalum notatum var. saurae]|uniref:Uncharacterized protein n=1 Tax=Paspalum notatum var. saurae TaxID=547442 RepID=A0AAQ3WHA3_PASNO